MAKSKIKYENIYTLLNERKYFVLALFQYNYNTPNSR